MFDCGSLWQSQVRLADEMHTNHAVSRAPSLLSNRGLAIKDLVTMWWSASAPAAFCSLYFFLLWDGNCKVWSEQKSRLITYKLCPPFSSTFSLLKSKSSRPSSPGWKVLLTPLVMSVWELVLSSNLTSPHGETVSGPGMWKKKKQCAENSDILETFTFYLNTFNFYVSFLSNSSKDSLEKAAFERNFVSRFQHRCGNNLGRWEQLRSCDLIHLSKCVCIRNIPALNNNTESISGDHTNSRAVGESKKK